MVILIPFAFAAGLATAFSPCVFPLLPIVLAQSAAGGRGRAAGVLGGFILFFTLITLSLGFLVGAAGIPPDASRWAAAAILALMGLILIIPSMKRGFGWGTGRIARFGAMLSGKSGSGFFQGLLSGAALGMVWTPCVGPILAGVITLIISGGINAAAVILTISFALGTALPMGAVLFTGRAAGRKWGFIRHNPERIQKIFGVVMIGVALMIASGADRSFQSWLLDRLPAYEEVLTRFEKNELVDRELERVLGKPEEERQ